MYYQHIHKDILPLITYNFHFVSNTDKCDLLNLMTWIEQIVQGHIAKKNSLITLFSEAYCKLIAKEPFSQFNKLDSIITTRIRKKHRGFAAAVKCRKKSEKDF